MSRWCFDWSNRVRRKLMHLRLQPIHVFLFHQVSEEYDPSLCNLCDWTQTEQFKKNVLEMKEMYRFISLSQARNHMSQDIFRWKKYAVLTSDDGAACLKTILPWLKEQNIPVTLFINGKYLDGVSYRNKPSEKYLNEKELFSLNYDGIEVGHHGWEHNDLTKMEWPLFVESVERSILMLQNHPQYVPFWAYTWGRHKPEFDSFLLSKGISPVLIDGMKNYCDCKVIHRELMDGKDFSC